jgi:hypothetical protein
MPIERKIDARWYLLKMPRLHQRCWSLAARLIYSMPAMYTKEK